MKKMATAFLLLTISLSTMAQSEKGYVVKKNKVYYNMAMQVMHEYGRVPENEIKTPDLKQSTSHPFFQDQLQPVEGADAKTFKPMGQYGVDKNHVFFKTDIVTEADPASFTLVEQADRGMSNIYCKDSKHVYLNGKVLKGADPSTFRYLTRDYAIDKYNIYGRGNALNIDPNKYKLVKNDFGGEYIIGSGKVSYSGLVINNMKAETFKLLGDAYATDGRIVVDGGNILDADAATFRKLLSPSGEPYIPYRETVFVDKNNAYHRGMPIKGAKGDAKVVGKNHFISDGKVFYRLDVIVNADAATFESLSECWGKDKNMVYCQERPIKVADPATFKAIGNDWYGFDKNHFIENDKAVTAIDGSTFRHITGWLFADSKYAYVIEAGKLVSKTPIDGKTFEKAGWNGKVVCKDKNHTYEYFDTKFTLVK